MCIAIMIPVGAVGSLTDDVLEECYEVNYDGIGYSFVKDSKLIIKKFMTYNEFKDEWDADKDMNDVTPIMLHFRATSVGDTDLDNCHPFKINESQTFCHNGTISKALKDKEGFASDTRMFNREMLRNLPDGWEDNAPIVKLIEHYILTSKLIILNLDSSYTIINEDLGEWSDGIWYSNKHYTGDYGRNVHGIAYKKQPTSYNHNGYNYKKYKKEDKKKDKKKNKKKDKQWKRESKSEWYRDYKQHPSTDIDTSDEQLCEWCNTYYREDELIVVDYGNQGHLFTVCHECASKIQFDSSSYYT